MNHSSESVLFEELNCLQSDLNWTESILAIQVNQNYESNLMTTVFEITSLLNWIGNSVLECRCPAEFSSNPNQTHLKKLINVFEITRKLQAGVFD